MQVCASSSAMIHVTNTVPTQVPTVNHIDREGLRLNFGHLVTCYTNERCLRCFSGIRLSFALSLIIFGRSRSRQQRVNITSITVFWQILYVKF